MKERPILFSGAMVRAILSGVKTQTRRVCKTSTQNQTDIMAAAIMDDMMGADDGTHELAAWKQMKCPYGEPGDRLWVRETWNYNGDRAVWEGGQRRPYDEIFVKYRADNEERVIHREPNDKHGLPKQRNRRAGEDEYAYWDYLTRFWRKWTPAIHMPRDMSRIMLEIVSVRVERLNEISEVDALAEGIDFSQRGEEPRVYRDYSQKLHYGLSPIGSYRTLWESINGPGSWEANEWVWVVEFKRIG